MFNFVTLFFSWFVNCYEDFYRFSHFVFSLSQIEVFPFVFLSRITDTATVKMRLLDF